jgi:hypothetical protein
MPHFDVGFDVKQSVKGFHLYKKKQNTVKITAPELTWFENTHANSHLARLSNFVVNSLLTFRKKFYLYGK